MAICKQYSCLIHNPHQNSQKNFQWIFWKQYVLQVHFRPDSFKNLQVIYLRPDFGEITWATNFLKLMLQYNITNIFPETIKILKPYLTTPMTNGEIRESQWQ